MANDKDFVVAGAVEVGKDTKVTLGTVTSNNIDLATGNYFADTLTGASTYTISNSGYVQSFQLEVTGGEVTYDIGSANYDSVSFSVASQDITPSSVAFNTTGTKMYVLGGTGDSVYQYTLSTGFDLSTASYDSVSFSVSSQDVNPVCLIFNTSGTKMYILGNVSDSLYQYSLSTGFDLSTASYDSVTLSVNGPAGNPRGFTFNNDGSKMYLADAANDSVFQYSLSTGFDLSTASYDSISLSVSSQDADPRGIAFNTDGTRLLMIGDANNSVFQYSLSTGFDLSTASYDSVSFNLAAQETGPTGLAFNDSGAKMYIVGQGTDTVYQYSTTATATVTWPSSIEWTGGSAPSAPATGETDVFTLSTDDGGTTYTGIKSIDNAS